MEKYKHFKFRIYPNDTQKEIIEVNINNCFFLYNKLIEENKENYEKTGKYVYPKSYSYYRSKYKWLNNSYSDTTALGEVINNSIKAYRYFFSKISYYPKFKSKKTSKLSYTTIGRVSTYKDKIYSSIKFKDNKLKLPKLKYINIRKKNYIIPKHSIPIKCTIIKENDNKYYATVLFKYKIENQDTLAENKYTEDNINEYKAIGLDFSMTNFYIDSEGNKAGNPKYYKKSVDKILKYEKNLIRCERGSNNRNKIKIKLAKAHKHISNQRRDYIHKLSHKLAESYDIVGIEDIKIKEFQRYKILKYGKLTQDIGWYSFTQMLSYKLADRGKRLVKVDKAYPSTQLCSTCGYRNSDLKDDIKTRKWICPKCGTHHDRDINAAINIKNEALRILVEE